MTLEKITVIDGQNHLLGRLSSVIAKQLLLGKKIVVVRCEGIVMSGKYNRMEHKYKMYLRKRTNSNPRRGPFHFRSPAKMLIKSVRGMLPQRTERGKEALSRLTTFVGVPSSYSTKKRMIVPKAHRIICLSPSNPFNPLKRLAKNFGWKYSDVTDRLEEKRKRHGLEHFNRKKTQAASTQEAKKRLGDKLINIETQLLSLGYAC